MNLLPWIITAIALGGILGVLAVHLLTAMTRPVGEPLIIKVKYLADIDPLEKINAGDWIDLRAAEDVNLNAGQYAAIPLGVAMELPDGYEAMVAPRSSLFKKHGLIQVNSPAVIDETYCGDNDEWHLLVYALRDAEIKKNERICQFRIYEHMTDAEFYPVETLGNADRGGIGSTGRM